MEYCAEGNRCDGCEASGLSVISRAAIPEMVRAVAVAEGWTGSSKAREAYLNRAAAEAFRDAGSSGAAQSTIACKALKGVASRILNNDCSIQENLNGKDI